MPYKNLKIKLPKVDVATGLYSNIDSIIKVDDSVLKRIRRFAPKRPRKLVLNSIGEIAYTLYNAMKNGGSEFLISEKAYRKLIRVFPKREMRVGGNGSLMGHTLALVRTTPVVSYPSRAKQLMRIAGDIKVVTAGKLEPPRDSIRQGDPVYEHIIFEFKKDRHILTYDPMTTHGFFDHHFIRLATNPKFIDVLILSYAHLLLPEYKHRTDIVLDYLSKDERPKVHLELGMGSKESMKYAIERFAGYCDSLGMNEKECKTFLGAKSFNKDHLIKACVKALETYNLKRVCVHTKKFAFSVSDNDYDKEFDALTSGCLVASAKTFGKLNLEEARKLKTSEKQVKKKIGKHRLCLVPCLQNPDPKVLAGIGDAFTSIQAVKALS